MTNGQEEGQSTHADTFAAAERMAACRPVWVRTATAAELIGLPPGVLLHAGPPFASVDAVPAPVLNSACMALLLEGRAASLLAAKRLLSSGAVQLCSAQDRGVVVPLAAVVSSSMWLHQVIDATRPGPIGLAPISDGVGPAQRFGIAGPEVLQRLQFVHRQVGPALARALKEPMDILPLVDASLAAGDETHGRVGVGSRLLGDALSTLSLPEAVCSYLKENTQGFLNLWMAACCCMAHAARGGEGNTLLVAAGGNGLAFGLQLGGQPNVWRFAASPPVVGPALRPDLQSVDRLPAIGDSALIDALGFGALALDAAPEHARLFGEGAVDAAMTAARRQLLVARHPLLGRKLGLDAAAVSMSALPGVCLAALDAAGRFGIVGRGLAMHPIGVYRAVAASHGDEKFVRAPM